MDGRESLHNLHVQKATSNSSLLYVLFHKHARLRRDEQSATRDVTHSSLQDVDRGEERRYAQETRPYLLQLLFRRIISVSRSSCGVLWSDRRKGLRCLLFVADGSHSRARSFCAHLEHRRRRVRALAPRFSGACRETSCISIFQLIAHPSKSLFGRSFPLRILRLVCQDAGRT